MQSAWKNGLRPVTIPLPSIRHRRIWQTVAWIRRNLVRFHITTRNTTPISFTTMFVRTQRHLKAGFWKLIQLELGGLSNIVNTLCAPTKIQKAPEAVWDVGLGCWIQYAVSYKCLKEISRRLSAICCPNWKCWCGQTDLYSCGWSMVNIRKSLHVSNTWMD